MKHYERVCAYIDLDAILHNMDCMKKNIAKDTKIVAVIKTDGYGHGAVRIAKFRMYGAMQLQQRKKH